MKQFLVFAFHIYYPSGGWGDFKVAFQWQDEAQDYADWLVSQENNYDYDWAQIVDLEELSPCYTTKRSEAPKP